MTAAGARWWREAVFYQIYPRSFQDTDGDGIGDLPGIASRLDYLTWLGVDALWLSPFYRSPMLDFGYDVSDHCEVDPTFGTLYDFDRLLEEAHRLGLRVIVDFVPNHTSSEHPWFAESRSSRDNPWRDWYIWADPRPDGTPGGAPPNNWLSYWGGSAWEFDEHTGQYYLHSFMPEMPDLNWRNPEVCEAMLRVAHFWLQRGVDGFRVDSAQQIMKDPEFRDNPANPEAGKNSYKNLGGYDAQLHLHDKGHPDIHEVYKEFRALLDSYGRCGGRERVALAEVHVFDRPEWASEWSAYYGADLDEFHLPLNLTLVGKPWNAKHFREAVEEMERTVPEGAWPNWVLGSHDEPRVASRIGREKTRAATMLLLTLRGTPTVYYGDELGMKDVPLPPERVLDPFEKMSPGLGLGRDPERSPMQWDATENAGFCPAGVKPWLPVADDYEVVNVAAQKEDPRSNLTLTRELLELRHKTPVLSGGDYETLLHEGIPEDCLCYLRAPRFDSGQGSAGHDSDNHGAASCLVALNFSGEERKLRPFGADEEGATGSAVLLSTHLDRRGPACLSPLWLRAREGCIVLLPGHGE